MIEGSSIASTVMSPLSKNGVSRDYGDDEDVYKGEAHRSAFVIDVVLLNSVVQEIAIGGLARGVECIVKQLAPEMGKTEGKAKRDGVNGKNGNGTTCAHSKKSDECDCSCIGRYGRKM
jgi:hypothetical protein